MSRVEDCEPRAEGLAEISTGVSAPTGVRQHAPSLGGRAQSGPCHPKSLLEGGERARYPDLRRTARYRDLHCRYRCRPSSPGAHVRTADRAWSPEEAPTEVLRGPQRPDHTSIRDHRRGPGFSCFSLQVSPELVSSPRRRRFQHRRRVRRATGLFSSRSRWEVPRPIGDHRDVFVQVSLVTRNGSPVRIPCPYRGVVTGVSSRVDTGTLAPVDDHKVRE